MLAFLASVAFGADATFALSVLDPTGRELVHDEAALPTAHDFEITHDGRTWVLDVQTTPQGSQVELHAVLGEKKKSGKVKKKSDERILLDEDVMDTVLISPTKKGGSWEVTGQWAKAFTPTEPTPGPTSRSRYVLLWDDAPLYRNPRNKTDIEIELELPDGRNDRRTQTSPFKAVHSWGTTHFEVESVPRKLEPHCYDGAPPRRSHPFQFYAANVDMVTVTTTEITASFGDGTGYTVAAGVAVEDRDGQQWIRVGDLGLPIRVSQENLGTLYRPTRHFPTAETGWTASIGENDVIGQTQLGDVYWYGDGDAQIQGRTGVEQPAIIIRTRCVEVRLSIDGQRVHRPK